MMTLRELINKVKKKEAIGQNFIKENEWLFSFDAVEYIKDSVVVFNPHRLRWENIAELPLDKHRVYVGKFHKVIAPYVKIWAFEDAVVYYASAIMVIDLK